MAVTTTVDGGMVTLHVDGSIDSHLGDALQAATHAALTDGKRRFLVNLQKARHANSAGLEALVRVAQLVAAGDARIALVGPPPLLVDVFEATRLARRFAVFESTEQAVQGLRGGGQA